MARSRFIAGAMALFAAALAGYTLRPTGTATSATLAARNPAVEVRTVVIHRTVHIVRHAHRRRGAQVSPGRRVAGRAAITAHRPGAAGPVPYAAARTRTSGSHAAGSAPAAYVPNSSVRPVTTRSSGSHAAGYAPAAAAPSSSARPVTTRSSGSHGSGSTSAGSGSGAGKPVTTRTSGSGSAHHDDGSGHGDD
ncbi:MAG TPA: hypothetical protein VFN55_15070 [Solirubrobacteraceae bacterium]|nr:hypothetical protein [Solirubrobacteraceae bacterium]